MRFGGIHSNTIYLLSIPNVAHLLEIKNYTNELCITKSENMLRLDDGFNKEKEQKITFDVKIKYKSLQNKNTFENQTLMFQFFFLLS